MEQTKARQSVGDNTTTAYRGSTEYLSKSDCPNEGCDSHDRRD